MDNFVDVLLEDTEIVTRPPKAAGAEIPTDTLLAEHGLCLLVKVQHGADRQTILLTPAITAAAFCTIWTNWPLTRKSWRLSS